MFSALLLLLCFHSNIQAQWFPKQVIGEWHVLLIAATADQLAGNANEQSLQRAEKELSTMAQVMDLDLHIYRITGEVLTEEAVKQGVRQLIGIPKPAQGKLMATVITFTHGVNFKDTWTRLPFMVCNPSTYRLAKEKQSLIALEDIYHSLRAFGSFDHVHVWAELCNNIPYGFEREAPKSKPFLNLKNNLQIGKKGERLRQLLLGVPSSLMVSASYGQISYAFKNTGGLFTDGLFMGLQKVAEGTVKPQFDGNEGLFEFVKLHTQQLVQQLAGNMRQQSPQGYVGDIPHDIPMPASNIIRTVDKMNQTKAGQKKKSAIDMIEELQKP